MPLDIQAFEVPFSFESRPTPVPPELRISWRLPLLLMVLNRCRAQRASLVQLLVLNWAVRTEEGQEGLLRARAGQRKPGDILLRFDPALNRTIDFALGEELVSWIGARLIQLTPRGREIASSAWATMDLLVTEKDFIQRLPQSLTQAEIDALL